MIEFTAASCLFEIRVNDNPMITLNLKGQMSTKIPVNHGISKTGPLEISIKVLPVLGETFLTTTSFLEYDISLFDVSTGFEEVEQIGNYKTTQVQDNTSVSLITDTKLYTATVPYKMNAHWENGLDIADIKDLNSRLRNTFNNIIDTIKKRDYSTYQEIITQKEYNISTSMYLTQRESQARIKRLIRDFENGYNVLEFPENVVPITSAYGKKVTLKRLDGDPALSYGNIEEQEQIMLDLEFYWSKESNKFEVI
ncbi:hypothetical protein [Aquimarina pacifica]|uniref:hypothetical protein n=1 Tax=Aquimarina pacifica TaxID=1296415 RepID=UPI0004715A6A|nr:hypothetical protein [Aquimarina pacifica]